MTEGQHSEIDSKVLIKSTLWYTASSFLTKAIGFITIPIFTRIMTKQQYADFSVFASWQSIFLIICGIEIYATLNKARFDFKSDNELNSYISSCLVLSTIFTAIIFLIYIVFPSFWDRFFLLERKYVFFMFAYIFTQPAFQMFQSKQRIKYKYKLSAGVSFFLIIFSTLLAVILVWRLNDKLLGRIAGQYFPYIIVGMLVYCYYMKKGHSFSFEKWKYALKLGLPLVFSFLGSQILLYSDRIVVQHLGLSEEVAWLVLATSGAHIMLLFVQALNNAWAPWFYDKLKLELYAEIKRIYRIYMWLIVACTFVILMFGPEIVAVLGGEGYNASVYVLPANMLCGIFTVISTQFVNLETYHQKAHYAAILTSIIAAINIIGDIIGVNLFGYQAACYVTVFCQLLLISLHYVASLKFEIKKILSSKDLLFVLLVSLLLIPFSLFLYETQIIRIVFISIVVIVACVVLIWKRNVIIRSLYNLKKVR